MAILFQKEMFDARRGTIDADSGARTYVREFAVQTNSAATEQLAILQLPGIPRVYDSYVTSTATDLWARCIRVEAQQVEANPYTWRVTCEYSTFSGPSVGSEEGGADATGPGGGVFGGTGAGVGGGPGSWLGGQGGQWGGAGGAPGSGGAGGAATPGQPMTFEQMDNPLLRPAVIEWDSETFRKPIEEDITGRWITNSTLLEKFDPPIERDDSYLKLTISRNEASFDATLAAMFQHSVNEDSFFGFDPITVLCRRIRSSTASEGKTFFWRTSYEFAIRYDPEVSSGSGKQPTWDLELLDSGYYFLSGGLRRILENDGSPSSKPRLLDNAGGVLAVGGTPVYLTPPFQIYKRKTFSRLNLP